MKYTEKTIKTERYTVTIHKPILSDCDLDKQKQGVENALAKFGQAIENKKLNKDGKQHVQT